MKLVHKYSPLLALVLFAFGAGFAARSITPHETPKSLTPVEMQFVGTWRHFDGEDGKELDCLAFYGDRHLRIGHGGMSGHWRISNDKLEIFSLECVGTDWGRGEASTFYDFTFNDSADQLAISIDGSLRAKLVRAFSDILE